MIEVQHLTKRYGRVTAVDDVSFRVEPGEILGFLGPNGAGKTTTMRILTGYMPPTDGRARVAGYDVFEQSLDVRRNVGYLPETVPLSQKPRGPCALRTSSIARLSAKPRCTRPHRGVFASSLEEWRKVGLGQSHRRMNRCLWHV